MNLKNGVLRGLEPVNTVGEYVGPLLLRLLLAVEFGSAGLEKLHGDNWFADIQDQFPFPFNVIPVSVSWFMATWFELIGAAALILGLGARFFAISLTVLTVVAISAVHWPAEWNDLSELALGYAISDDGHGNFKLPLMYLVMLLPLVLQGPGKLSIDALIWRWASRGGSARCQ